MSHIQCCTNADLEYATLRLRDHPLSLTAYGTYATGYIQQIGQHNGGCNSYCSLFPGPDWSVIATCGFGKVMS